VKQMVDLVLAQTKLFELTAGEESMGLLGKG
jgi:hypothetical protein